MDDPDDIRLNVAAVARSSRVNGPGLRAVVWVQGCTIGCPECFNPETHAHAPRRLVEPGALAGELCAAPGLDGITLSGGEPFEQAAACARVAEIVRARGLSVMVFTGYPYGLLTTTENAEVQRFLGAIDLLVSGPWVRARAIAPVSWRASANQEFRVLTDRGRLALAEPSRAPCVEASSDGRTVSWSGFPEAEDIAFLERASRGKRS